MKRKILFGLVIMVLLGLAVFFLNFGSDDTSGEVTNFQECVEAGYPVMESYPRQCRDSEGNLFVEEIEFELGEEFYGSSSMFPCESDEGCMISGCNGEICQSIEEESFASICLYPEEPLPEDLGYRCGCFDNKCQWSKD